MSRDNRDSRRKSYDIPGHAHELTFSCYKRYPFLGAERCCQWLAEAVAKARESQQFRVWAFVFMPDHAHLIVYPFAPKYKMSRILEAIKQPVGAKAIAYLKATKSEWLPRLTRKRGKRIERVFWQSGGGYDRNITSPKTLLRMIDYLHENPVRKKLVVDSRDWFWSSARYFGEGESPIPIDPVPPEWLEVES